MKTGNVINTTKGILSNAFNINTLIGKKGVGAAIFAGIAVVAVCGAVATAVTAVGVLSPAVGAVGWLTASALAAFKSHVDAKEKAAQTPSPHKYADDEFKFVRMTRPMNSGDTHRP
jgi:hypothetical protein